MNERASREVKRIPAGDRTPAVVAGVEAVWEAACPDEGSAPEDVQELDTRLAEQVPDLYEALHADPAICDGLVEFALSSLRAAGLVQTEASLRILLRDAESQGEK